MLAKETTTHCQCRQIKSPNFMVSQEERADKTSMEELANQKLEKKDRFVFSLGVSNPATERARSDER